MHERTQLPQDRLATLLTRYGTRAAAVAEFLAEGSDAPLCHHDGYSRREIEFIARHERVVHLDDLLLRRTVVALLGELTGELLDELAAIIAEVRRWSKEETDREITRTVDILRDRFGVRVRGE